MFRIEECFKHLFRCDHIVQIFKCEDRKTEIEAEAKSVFKQKTIV